MPKKSAVKVTFAAALIVGISGSPVLARGSTRSFESLPSTSARAMGSVGEFGANNGNGFGRGGLPGFLGWKPPIRLPIWFSNLPYNVQQTIADALADSGPRGEQLCRVLGIPECELPDSTG